MFYGRQGILMMITLKITHTTGNRHEISTEKVTKISYEPADRLGAGASCRRVLTKIYMVTNHDVMLLLL